MTYTMSFFFWRHFIQKRSIRYSINFFLVGAKFSFGLTTFNDFSRLQPFQVPLGLTTFMIFNSYEKSFKCILDSPLSLELLPFP